MKYCSECGSDAIIFQVPKGDNHQRHVCVGCGHIHYVNPKVVAGTILEWEDKILLCRRAIEPRYGTWTLPAGYMENGETTQGAASRETWEEARARPIDLKLFSVTNLPHISQVYMIFRGILEDGYAAPGPESLEIGLFEEANIPWDQLAFPVIHESLSLFFKDRRCAEFPVHLGDIWRDETKHIQFVRY